VSHESICKFGFFCVCHVKAPCSKDKTSCKYAQLDSP
jgi:hypothetical protein